METIFEKKNSVSTNSQQFMLDAILPTVVSVIELMFASARDGNHKVILCTVLNYIVKLTGNWANLIYEEGKSSVWHEFIMRRTYRQTSAQTVSCRLIWWRPKVIQEKWLRKYCLFLGVSADITEHLMMFKVWFFKEKHGGICWQYDKQYYVDAIQESITHTHSEAGKIRLNSLNSFIDKSQQFFFISCFLFLLSYIYCLINSY